MRVVNVRTLDEYKKGSYIGRGHMAECYLINGRVYKIYTRLDRIKKIFKTRDMIEFFDYISEYGNDTVITPDELYVKDGEVLGYSYPYVEGITLSKLNSHIKLDDYRRNYDKLLEGLASFSESKYRILDMHNQNVLFDGNYFHIIDIDNGTFPKINNEEEQIRSAFIENCFNIHLLIFNTIFKASQNQLVTFNHDQELQYVWEKSSSYDIDSIQLLFNELEERTNEKNPTLGKIRHKIKHEIIPNEYINND